MLNSICNCQKCNLCINQKPLLDDVKNADIFWVGLSAKLITFDEEKPLSPTTNTGTIIKQIEDSLPNYSFYKTNLVKCVPLNNNKIRYPNKSEMNCCYQHLLTEIDELKPKCVFLLGDKVSSYIASKLNVSFQKWEEYKYFPLQVNGIYFISIYHPSYIYVYKRKYIDQYVNAITDLVLSLC